MEYYWNHQQGRKKSISVTTWVILNNTQSKGSREKRMHAAWLYLYEYRQDRSPCHSRLKSWWVWGLTGKGHKRTFHLFTWCKSFWYQGGLLSPVQIWKLSTLYISAQLQIKVTYCYRIIIFPKDTAFFFFFYIWHAWGEVGWQ